MSDVREPTAPAPTILAYPGSVLRPIPSFVFTLPAGWVVDDAPDAIAAIRTPEEVEGFLVNALISHDRVPKAVNLEQAAKVSFARLKERSPDVSVTLERVVRFDTNVVYLRGVELSAPQSGRKLGQLHALFFAPSDSDAKTVDFFQMIGTAPVEVMTRIGPVFASVISSLRFV
jgi:hypothetical protein